MNFTLGSINNYNFHRDYTTKKFLIRCKKIRDTENITLMNSLFKNNLEKNSEKTDYPTWALNKTEFATFILLTED